MTDLPSVRPLGSIRPDQKERHVVLSLKMASSESEISVTVALVKAVFAFIDALEGGKLVLRPEVRFTYTILWALC